MSGCLPSQFSRKGGYDNLADFDSPVPATSSAASIDTNPSITTTSPVAAPAAATGSSPQRPGPRDKSSERHRGRRTNIDPAFGHHSQLGANQKDTVLCPTCRGKGKVPKEKEGHLVALIPADDERLQPSKTKTYAFIAVVTSLLLAFLTIFFIYPRSFNLRNKEEPDLFPIGLYINTTEQVVRFRIQNWWFLENPNYYPIQLTNLNVQAYRLNEVSDTSNVTVVTIALRSKIKIYTTFQIEFKDDLSYLVDFCNDDRWWVHTIPFRFQATAVVNIMGYNFTSIAETNQKVSCGRNKTTTVAPLTTSTTTLLTTTTTPLSTTTTTTSPESEVS